MQWLFKKKQLYYQQSLKLSIKPFSIMLLLSSIVIFLLSFIYSLITVILLYNYGPIFYMAVTFGTLIYGGILGLIARVSIWISNVRHRIIAIFLFAGIILMAEYFTGVFWVFFNFKRKLLIWNPRDLLYAIMFMADSGWEIYIGGYHPYIIRGQTIYLIWLVKFLILLLPAIAASYPSLQVRPFCEKCRDWVENVKIIEPLELIPDPKKLKKELENHYYSSLIMLNKIDSSKDTYTRIKLRRCFTCMDSFYLSVSQITYWGNYHVLGKPKKFTTSKKYVKNLKIDEELYLYLCNTFGISTMDCF